jgi:Poly A polymerase regulatory subunit
LFGVEFRFLTQFLSSLEEKAFVVYAGSSPSLHLHYLSTLFPCVKFLLVDPAQTILRIGKRTHLQTLVEEVLYLRTRSQDTIQVKAFCSDGKTRRKQRREVGTLDTKLCIDQFFKGKQSIYIFEEYFDVELAELIRDCTPSSAKLLFWSDIRTNLDEKNHPEALDIAWNLAQQLNWVRALQPNAYLLKFKHPFWNANCTKEQFLVRSKHPPYASAIEGCGVDFSSPLLTYLKGEVWLQPFSRPMSAETRLVGVREREGDPYPLTEYDPREYENKMMFFNAIERTVCFHHNPLIKLGVGYDQCSDCAYEAKLWAEYKSKLDPRLDLKVAIQDLGVVTRGLEKHGKVDLQTKRTKRV